jgi:hypothetical protein
MDVAVIFKYGWKSATDSQKNAARAELKKMLDWCLSKSLQSDGSFKYRPGDISIEEGIGYGVSFLSELGFFSKEKRFWTNEEFADSNEVRKKIKSYILAQIENAPTGGAYYEGALEDLNEN